MLIKIRKWVTIAGAFLFVLSVTYTAFTIDSNLKKEAIKKLNQRRKENEPKSSLDLTPSPPPLIPPDSSQPDQNLGERKTIGTAFTDPPGTQLSKCKVWMLASQALLTDDFWRCSVESALAQTTIEHSWNQEDDYEDEESNSRHSVCLISDRFAQPQLNLSSSHSSWIWSLQDKYGKDRLIITAPDYVSVFAGTLFEEIYINSGDMSFLGAALIWSLMWKYGGLFVQNDTLLLLSLKSYYNFVVLNSAGTASSLALVQLESQHSLASNALHHLMEQLQRRSSYVNFFHPVNNNNNKNVMPKLKPLTDKDWTQELESFCGKKLEKGMSGKFCQDTEIVDSDSVPRLSDKKLVKQWIRNVGTSPYSARTLAVQIALNDDDKASLLQDRHIRRWLRSICPIMFHMK